MMTFGFRKKQNTQHKNPTLAKICQKSHAEHSPFLAGGSCQKGSARAKLCSAQPWPLCKEMGLQTLTVLKLPFSTTHMFRLEPGVPFSKPLT